MHEQSIAQKIIHDAKLYGEVKSLTVEVGDLAHLPASEMKEVLEINTNWKIKVIPKKQPSLVSVGSRENRKSFSNSTTTTSTNVQNVLTLFQTF